MGLVTLLLWGDVMRRELAPTAATDQIHPIAWPTKYLIRPFQNNRGVVMREFLLERWAFMRELE